jgi:thioredoxin reductase (NADPH)
MWPPCKKFLIFSRGLFSMNERVDLLIVGNGPAGLSAAIQAARDGVKHIVIGRQPHGGLIHSARLIENLPGFPNGIPGPQLAAIILAQVHKLGARIEAGEVKTCRWLKEKGYETELEDGRRFFSTALIVATGTEPEDFHCHWGEGIFPSPRLHREAKTLPPDLTGQIVAVVGAGEAALDTALNVVDRGGRVSLIVRSKSFRAPQRLVEAVQASSIQVHWQCNVIRVDADHGSLMLCVEDQRGDQTPLPCNHMVICVGRRPCTQLLKEMLPSGPREDVITPLPGLYLAGDLIRGRDRFVATAIGDGQRAARLAARFLMAF